MARFRRMLKRVVLNGASRFGYRLIPFAHLDSFDHSRHLRHLFDHLEIDTVLDVGANTGAFVSQLRQEIGFEGRIVSFEPVSDVFNALVRSAGSDRLWKGCRMALGHVDDELEINVCKRSTMSSFLSRDESRLSKLGYQHLVNVTDIVRTERVPVRRLDSIFDDVMDGRRDARVFLKCDTQGFDLQVIAGAPRTLPSVLGLQMEASIHPIYSGGPSFVEVLEKMSGAGFDLTGIFPVRRDELFRIVNFDCVMINSRNPIIADLAAREVRGHTPSMA